MARRPEHRAYPGRTVSPPDAGQDRALASDAQEPSPARKLLSTGRPRGRGGRLRRALQSRPLPRKPPQSHPRGRLLRTRPNHPPRTGKDQTTDDRQSPLAAPREGRLTSKPDEPEPPLLKPAPCLKLSDDGHSKPSELALAGRTGCLLSMRSCFRRAVRPQGRELLEGLVRRLEDGVALRDGLPAPDADVGVSRIKLEAVGPPSDLLG